MCDKSEVTHRVRKSERERESERARESERERERERETLEDTDLLLMCLLATDSKAMAVTVSVSSLSERSTSLREQPSLEAAGCRECQYLPSRRKTGNDQDERLLKQTPFSFSDVWANHTRHSVDIINNNIHLV